MPVVVVHGFITEIILMRIYFPSFPSPCRTFLRTLQRLLAVLLLGIALASCSSEKFLRPGQTLLSDVSVVTADKHVNPASYRGLVRQRPNSKWFTLLKVPLGIYCWSKADSVKGSKGLSGMWRKMGEAPVVYDSLLASGSAQSLAEAMRGAGYLHAQVETQVTHKRHKTRVTYLLRPGNRHFVSDLRFHVPDAALRASFRLDSARTLLRRGMPLDLNVLAQERGRIVRALRNRGHYFVNNDLVTFDVDTLAHSLECRLTVNLCVPVGSDTSMVVCRQRFRRVSVFEDVLSSQSDCDSTRYRGLDLFFHNQLRQTRRLYASHVSVVPDSLYSEERVQNTYANLNALPTIGYTNLKIVPVPGIDSLVDCQVFVKRTVPNTLRAELEGTNTSGDFGAAVSLSYSNRNLLRGAEQLMLKFRGAYEAITGLEGYANQNYVEWSSEMSLRFPTLLIPFVHREAKWRLKASSAAQLMYDSQDRPEFHRRVLTGAWTYRWSPVADSRWEHRWDLLSVNYVYMPWISDTFRKDYLQGDDPHYAVLRYSYENLFIVKTGYSFVFNSQRTGGNAAVANLYQTNGYQLRMGVELAGNVLYGLSKLFRTHQNDEGQHDLFGIAYSQYVKFDFDYSKSLVLNERNSLAFHTALGLGLPYGNSSILPYEKRYFSGGANSVRGWSVRELGPGAYRGSDGKVDFINQTGNLKLDLNVELRTYLFWKLHAALFVDAGNVWNTRNYPGMDDAQFRFDRFYKQIALSYGLGIRFNFDYFILRLDGGMKAVNPAFSSRREHYPMVHPSFKRDCALHFAVGLPF